MYERAAYLNSDEPSGEHTEEKKQTQALSTTTPTASTSNTPVKPWIKHTKRKHVRAHGKIGFKELSQRIVQKWKEVSPEEKEIYEKLAKDDLARYRKEMAEYEKMTNNASNTSVRKEKDAHESAQSFAKDNGTLLERSNLNGCAQEVNRLDPDSFQVLQNMEYLRSANDGSTGESGSGNKNSQPGSSPLLTLTDAPHSSGTYHDTSSQSDSLINCCESQCSTTGIDASHEEDCGSINDFESMGGIESISIDHAEIESITLGSFSLMSIDTDNGNKEQSFSVIYESLSTRIVRAVDTLNTLGGSTGFIAVKVLTDEFPDADSVSQLENEYNISQQLSECTEIRTALRLDRTEGQYALYLEWEPGITLKQWIKSSHKRTQDVGKLDYHNNDGKTIDVKGFDIENALYLARDVVRAVSKMHKLEVAHSNITTDNIIVNVDQTHSRFLVKIIDLGLASIVTGHQSKTEKIQSDLCSLGAVLFELFTGMSPYDSKSPKPCVPADSEQPYSREIAGGHVESNIVQPKMFSLLSSIVPPCIFTMVFNLMKEEGGSYFYQSAAKVDEDIQFMLSDARHFLYSEGNEKKIYPTSFQSEKLYGRNDHISILMDAYARVARPESSSEMVTVSGYSGAGKSALVQQAKQPITDMGGYFLCGKFDKLMQMEPLSAIILAFTEFCDQMIRKSWHSSKEAKSTIQEVVGPETSILTSVIPSLSQIVQMPISETIKVGGMEAQNRFKHVFRLFVRALATPEHPLVLFLDDLQWSDHDSLALIECLITDNESKSFLFIGSYRDNEVSKTHPLALQLCQLENKGVFMTKINVGNLGRESLNEMVSDLLRTTPANTASLADAVYRKTSGNVLFALQFLRTLYDEGLLHFSLDSRQWQWNTEMIESKGVPDSTVELMTCKILTFPTETQNALKLIACLGSSCEESVLSVIAGEDNLVAQQTNHNMNEWRAIPSGYNKLVSSFQVAVREGIVDHVDSKYKFTHDSFQQAAYSLIPEGDHDRWHVWIGNQIRANQTAPSEKALFIAVNQLNKGAMLISDNDQRAELARLNVQAAEISISFAAFAPASFYLKTGINLLNEHSWRDEYQLCLKLNDLYAEVEYCQGNFKEMDNILNDTFANAISLDDKLHAFFIRISALGAQGKPQEALEVGLLVLSQLGESISVSPDTTKTIMTEFSKTKQMLQGKTDDELLTLKTLNDSRKIAAMKLMNVLILFSFLARQKEYPMLVFKMVQMTLCHGICNESTIGFASYGGLLSQFFSDVHGAYRFGMLSIYLVEKLQAQECLARVYVTFHTFINAGTQHHSSSLEPLKHAIQAGMRCGDIQYSMLAARQFCIHSYQCGEKLATVEENFRKYGQQMEEHKQLLVWKLTLPYRQTVLNLMGHSSDPLQLSGEAMDQDSMLEEALQNKNQSVLACHIFHFRTWLAYIFGDYALASKLVEKSQAVDISSYPVFLKSDFVLIDGLVSFAMAHNNKQTKWKSNGQRAIEKMKIFAGYAPSNYRHKLLLLQAEYESVFGENDNAAQAYKSAIELAGENGFVQDQALAYERAAIFFMKKGCHEAATQYYGGAHDTYLKWGALCKANHLRDNLPL